MKLRALLADRRWTEAASVVRRALTPSSDFTAMQPLYRIYSELKPHLEPQHKTKLAILGGGTTAQLAQAIELALFSMGGGVETLLNNAVCRWAIGRGLKPIRGERIPTPKSGLVREHFAGLGYSKISEDGSGRTRWEMELSADWLPRQVFIEEQEFHE